MALTYQFYDAAHTYGLDNMGVNTAISNANLSKIGQYLSESTSWVGDEPPIGQPLSAKVFMSGGFAISVNFTITSETSATVTNVSLLRTNTNETLYSTTGSLTVTDADFDQLLFGTAILNGADNITGNRFNNALRGYGGNDRIDGGAGTDTAYFSGTASQNQIARNGTSFTVTGLDGADTLLNIERLRFDDKVIAFDTDGNAGQAYRLYQAAFNRTPDSSGLAFQVNTLDAGWGLNAIAQNFINSPEFVKTYGSLDNTKFVTQLYANVLHRGPDAGGLAYHVGNLDRGDQSRAQVLVGFSESPENQAALIGVIGNGMSYSTQFA